MEAQHSARNTTTKSLKRGRNVLRKQRPRRLLDIRVMSYIVEGFVRLYLEPFSLDAQSYGPLKGATCYTDSSRNRHLLLGIGLFSIFSAAPINAFHLHNWRLPLNANRTRDVMRLAYRHRTSSTTEPPYHILLQQQLRQAESATRRYRVSTRAGEPILLATTRIPPP